MILIIHLAAICAAKAVSTPIEEKVRKEYIEKFKSIIDIKILKITLIIPAPDPNEINSFPRNFFFFKINIPPTRTVSPPNEAIIISNKKIYPTHIKFAYSNTIFSNSSQFATPVVPEINKKKDEIKAR